MMFRITIYFFSFEALLLLHHSGYTSREASHGLLEWEEEDILQNFRSIE